MNVTKILWRNICISLSEGGGVYILCIFIRWGEMYSFRELIESLRGLLSPNPLSLD